MGLKDMEKVEQGRNMDRRVYRGGENGNEYDNGDYGESFVRRGGS